MTNAFKIFHSNLYSLDHELNQSEIDAFLNNLDLPILPREQANILEAPLTAEEVQALNNMANNKSPGKDGLPFEFCCHFRDILSSLFYSITSEIKVTIPMLVNTAVMTLLLKSKTQPSLPGTSSLTNQHRPKYF